MADVDWKEKAETRVRSFIENGNPAFLITPEEHPEFHRSLSELAKKSGLDYVPHFIVSEKITSGPEWTRTFPNGCAAPAARYVIVNNSMMKATGANTAERMTPELETLMAHEFSHLKDGPLHTEISFALPWVVPLLAVIGLGIYDEARSRMKAKETKNRKEYAAQLTAHVETVSDEKIKNAHAAAKTDEWGLNPSRQEHHIKLSTYLLTAAIGLAAGLKAASSMSIAAEFRADRRMVEITRNPEVFRKVLSSYTNAFREAVEKIPRGEVMGKSIRQKFRSLLEAFTMAHPTDEQRFKYMEQVEASLAAGARSPR